MDVSRRKFLKISGATIGLVAASSTIGGLVKKSNAFFDSKSEDSKGVNKIPTYCDICFWKCGAIAYVRDGKLWKVEGNPETRSAGAGFVREARAAWAHTTIKTG